jgi:hypothetical protein
MSQAKSTPTTSVKVFPAAVRAALTRSIATPLEDLDRRYIAAQEELDRWPGRRRRDPRYWTAQHALDAWYAEQVRQLD